MKAKDLPEGWSYEGPDESVGIFGEEFVHEDCTVLAGLGTGDTLGVRSYETQIGRPDTTGMMRVVRILVCDDCSEKITFETKEFVGVEEAA